MDPVEAQRLRSEIERTLRQAFDPSDVLPRLVRLSRMTPPASEDGLFAHAHLAELLVERSPWAAALYARRVLSHREDDRAWAVLAFAHTQLGHYRSAVKAYARALAASPENPWYAHNLGHLLDVALGRPAEALRYLRAAHRTKPESTEFVASFVHALARGGKTVEARRVLDATPRTGKSAGSRELDALGAWIDQGAPARTGPRAGQPQSLRAPSPKMPTAEASPQARRATPARRGTARARQLVRDLARGLAHLPFEEDQRVRAFRLAEEVASTILPCKGTAEEDGPEDVAGLAAAVAYAIVYVDHVPLTQAEVAAPFRVAVGRLRGRFAELRARLDLIRGDVRYRAR